MEFKTIVASSVSAGNISTQKITIKSNAKAFRLILGQIYPDIIKAIVRELFTNAWDSQKVAGTLDTPIDIHAPTKYDPYFSIRDYGVGMSEQTITNIFSQIFESTKDTSNEEAGMFGMGSKSPLGYTDQFSIISYIDGMMLYYDIHLDEDGHPIISLKVKQPTDEPNGVHVQVGVKTNDCQRFSDMIEYFILGANTPVKIDGKKFEDVYSIKAQGTNWQLVSHKSIDGLHVRMGCVLYKVRKEFLTYDVRSSYLQSIINIPLIIDVPIGNYDVTGSREDILYNNEAISSLVRYAHTIREELKRQVESEIKKKKTFLEAYQYCKNVVKGQILDLFDRGELVWRGRNPIFPQTSSAKLFHDMKIFTIKRKSLLTCKEVPWLNYDDKRNYKIAFIPADTKRRTTRIRQFIKSLNMATHTALVVEGDPNSFSMKKLMARTGATELVDISKIEILKVVYQSRSTKPKDKVFDFKTHGYVEFNKNKFTKYYIEKSRKAIDDHKLTRALGFLLPTNNRHVAMLTKADSHLIGKHNLINLIDEYQTKINQIVFTDYDIINWMITYRHGYDRVNRIVMDCLYSSNSKHKRSKLLHLVYEDLSPDKKKSIDLVVAETFKNINHYIDNIPLLKFVDGYKIQQCKDEFTAAAKKEIALFKEESKA